MDEKKENLYYLGARFRGSEKSYYFSTPITDFQIGDLVVLDTASGYEIGTVSTPVMNQSLYKGNLMLKPIVRKPTESDMLNYNFNLQEEKRALEITRREIEALGLPMSLIEAIFTLDGSKVTISYTSTEKRVDFRELLRVIVPQLSCRVELRQIASRDKAKMIGGLGICGLPLCCSSFLNQFEGISIQRAKNQMLTLNIPKLSGPCGKLICCLLYEDDAYTEAKKEFPRFGTPVRLDEGDYVVDGMNILSKTVRLATATRDDFKTYPLEDVLAMIKGTYKKREAPKPVVEELPSFNIPNLQPRKNENQNPSQPQNGKKNNNNQNNNRHQNRPNQQQNNQNRNNNGQGQNGNQNQGQNRNNHHRRHRHHHNNGGNKAE